MNAKSLIVLLSLLATIAYSETDTNIYQATLMEPTQGTSEISTEELRQILADRSATVFDARPFNEFAISHIPGAVHVGGKPGTTSAHYTSDANAIAHVVKETKAAPIVLYCSGPFCGRSKQAARDLVAAGYNNVRRYQLGMPIWRALGGVTQIELEGIRYLFGKDQTAVWLDVRDPEAFTSGTLAGAQNLPHSGVVNGDELDKAQKDVRLPVEDHNTRIIVLGDNGAEAKAVAEALTRTAFHNVAFYAEPVATLHNALK